MRSGKSANLHNLLMKFEELNLAPAILKAVLEQGYDTPTPIQAQTVAGQATRRGEK